MARTWLSAGLCPADLLAAIVFTLLAVLFVAGCKPQQAPEEKTPTAAVSRHYEKGGFTVDLHLSVDTLTTAQQLVVDIEISLPESHRYAWPDLAEKLGDFTVKKALQEEPRLNAAGQVTARMNILLEPFLPGEYELPALTLTSWPKDETEAEPVEIVTEAIPIEVTSVLPAAEQAPEIRELLNQEQAPKNYFWWYVAGVGGLLIAGLLAWYLWKRHKTLPSAPPPLPPHVVAMREFDRLLADRLHERGELRLFYFRLSAILRYYIERRFGLSAPEQTTEEFLAAIGWSAQSGYAPAPSGPKAGLNSQERELLGDFLQHCDLVKFAGYRPASREVEQSMALFKDFIAQTTPTPEGGQSGHSKEVRP